MYPRASCTALAAARARQRRRHHPLRRAPPQAMQGLMAALPSTAAAPARPAARPAHAMARALLRCSPVLPAAGTRRTARLRSARMPLIVAAERRSAVPPPAAGVSVDHAPAVEDGFSSLEEVLKGQGAFDHGPAAHVHRCASAVAACNPIAAAAACGDPRSRPLFPARRAPPTRGCCAERRPTPQAASSRSCWLRTAARSPSASSAQPPSWACARWPSTARPTGWRSTATRRTSRTALARRTRPWGPT